MSSSWRALAYCIAAGCLMTAASAQATNYSTDGGSGSDLTIEFWFGPPGGGSSTLLQTIGPLEVTGGMVATVSVDGSGDGTLTIDSSDLVVEDTFDNTVTIGFLGSVDVDLEEVLIDIVSSAISVTGNEWNLDLDPPSSFDLGLVDGVITLHDVTGFLPIDDPTILDLETDPFSVGLTDISGYDIGGTASEEEITIDIPAIDIDISEPVFGGSSSGILFIRLYGTIDVVAEP